MNSLLSIIPGTGLAPSRKLFDRFFDDWGLETVFSDDNEWVPAFDIAENEKDYAVTAELPGIDIKDVDITLSEGILTVKGEKKQEKEETVEGFHRIERCYGSFNRSFRIPGKVEADKIDASYKDGVLKVVLPKAEGTETKKIEIR
ncbi:MAG: Hsp20/alpha crystallin family protein [Desulfatiglans sp.]|jgi:HSP20 family protein|nr:Hsp20/alpha crystallin family protein [Desulfatiglans sp.]